MHIEICESNLVKTKHAPKVFSGFSHENHEIWHSAVRNKAFTQHYDKASIKRLIPGNAKKGSRTESEATFVMCAFEAHIAGCHNEKGY